MRKYRNKRRTSTAKRRYRKRISRKSGAQRSQGYIREKFKQVVAIEVGGIAGAARRISIPIGQMNKGSSIPGITRITYDQTARWDQVYLLYEQYAVKGVKVKFVPSNLNGTVNWQTGAAGNDYHTAYVLPIETWYDEDSYDAAAYAPLQRINLDSHRVYQPGKGFKRYISNKGPTARAKSEWQNCQAYEAAAAVNENTLPDNTFNLLFDAPGMPNEYTT